MPYDWIREVCWGIVRPSGRGFLEWIDINTPEIGVYKSSHICPKALATTTNIATSATFPHTNKRFASRLWWLKPPYSIVCKENCWNKTHVKVIIASFSSNPIMSSARLITTTLGPSEPSFWLHPRACLTSATAQRQQSQMLNVSSNGWGPQPWQIAPDPFANSNTTNQIKTICRIWTNSNHINIWNHPKHTQPPSCRRFIFASFSPVAPSTSIAWVADARPPSSCWASGRPPRRLPARSRVDLWNAGDWWNLTFLCWWKCCCFSFLS